MDLFGLRWVGPNRQYRLRRHLAEDDLGSLWLGESTSTGTPSTIRILASQFAADPFLVRRIGREIAPVFDLLIHPNVALVTNYSLLDDERYVFVVMEALDGQTLRARLEDPDPIPLPDALRLAAEVASGLEAAHRLGIVHGAIGPDSVFLTPGRAKVFDFGLGIARHWRDGVTSASASSERPASPERHRPLDAYSDVEAVAALLSTLVAGRRPEESGQPEAFESSVTATEEASAVLPRPVGDALRLAGDREHQGDLSMAMLANALRGQTERPPTVVLDLTRRTARASHEAPPARGLVRPVSVGGHRDHAASRHPSTAGRPAPTRPPQATGAPPDELPEGTSRREEGAVSNPTIERPPAPAPAGGLEEALRIQAASREPRPRRHSLRVAAILVASLVLVATAVLAGGLLGGDDDVRSTPGAAGPTVATSAAPTTGAPTGGPDRPAAIFVPSVAGMRPFDAVTLLTSLGLEVAGARAVPGDPGLVVDTDPAAGTSLEPGSAVTLLVGAPADRRSATPT